jgi:hypothetical protein
MATEAWDDLVAAHATLAEIHARTSNYIADVLDGFTEACVTHPTRLARVVKLRTEGAELLGQVEDALAELEAAIEALAPADSQDA